MRTRVESLAPPWYSLRMDRRTASGSRSRTPEFRYRNRDIGQSAARFGEHFILKRSGWIARLPGVSLGLFVSVHLPRDLPRAGSSPRSKHVVALTDADHT